MSAWTELLDQLFPARCPGCDAAMAPLCPNCPPVWGPVRRVRPACLDATVAAYALGGYEGPRREALLDFKERGSRRLARPLGIALAAGVASLPGPPPPAWWLVPVPSRPAAAARRGGQHVEWLARAAAAELARHGVVAGMAPALRMRRTIQDSVGLDRRSRRANLEGRVRVRRSGLPPAGTDVVLVDDVITTGSTASACTETLARMGVRVRAFVALTAADRYGRMAFP